MHADQVNWDNNYKRAQAKKGLKKTQVWVPAEKISELREFAKKLRQDAKAE